MTGHTDATRISEEFFARYAQALLARDADALAAVYAIPALIEFPDQPLVVSDAAQTETFFRGAFPQYADVTTATPNVTVVAESPHSIWADVTWDYAGDAPQERFIYQLGKRGDAWQIVVLTPLAG